MTATALAFDLPTALEAREPPEARGVARDGVRLLVASRATGALEHRRFHDLPEILSPGDLVVVNTSATLPAAIGARRRDGRALRVHAAMPAPGLDGDTRWLIELRSPDGSSPLRDGRAGERVELDGGAVAELLAPYAGEARLWLARIEAGVPLVEHLAGHGVPIRYGYVPEAWPIEDYQNVYALQRGSAEMPSAGRPFTPELVTRLVASGIQVAPVVLHTGVSSPERHEAPYPERFLVPAATARLVNAVRSWGGRVIAVGTTAVRALESATDEDGTVTARQGWTSLVIGAGRRLRAIDGLITGWHEPQASHLDV
ncbi:MAG: S-adenosylmethionine:tRNA ribosyltransferase-isomerase, partial [Solirubrobacteraceae bacterium]|nr:S-adenosylmethionine:tRNA ribosyltransferase-isomerase [Solirubrobacteraceae bacterium]